MIDKLVSLLTQPPWAASMAAVLLVFCRVGGVLAVFPGYSMPFVNARVRLMAALALSVALQPLLLPLDTAIALQKGTPLPDANLIINEVLIGLMMGATARLFETVIGTASALVAQASGLSNVFDPHVDTGGGTGISTMMSLAAMAAFWASNGHLVLIKVLINSYRVLPFAQWPSSASMAEHLTTTVVKSFNIGVQFAGPFLVFGWCFNLVLGFVNRLLPQLAVFFIGQPVAVLMGLLLMVWVLPLWIGVWLTYFNNLLVAF